MTTRRRLLANRFTRRCAVDLLRTASALCPGC